MNDQFQEIPIEQLVDPWVLLRPVVTNSVEYIELFESLKEIGFLNSISVRPSTRKPECYEVIDGLWRTTCAREIGLATVPCIIKYEVSDDDVLAFQIQANAIRPKTKPVAFAQQIRRIQKIRPDITLADLASLVNKKPGWVRSQLGLLTLEAPIQRAVNRGEINLSNAYMIAKIPPKLRADFIETAKIMGQKEFQVLAAGVIKQFKEAVKQGKLEAFFVEAFKVQPYLRSMKDIKGELEECLEGPLLMAGGEYRNALEGWKAALEWALHLDPESKDKQEREARSKAQKKWAKGV